MNPKPFAGVVCVGIFCAAGWAHAQSTGTTGTGNAATSTTTSTDRASSAPAKHGTTSKTSSSDKSRGSVASPAGGIAHPKDVSPGTYTQTGEAVPRTTDPMQTKNARDGTPLPNSTPRAANAASAAQK